MDILNVSEITISEAEYSEKYLEKKMFEDCFALVEAESLSLDDELMCCRLHSEAGRNLRDFVKEPIRAKVKNFYAPLMAPAFTDDGAGICYEAGKEPAVGQSYKWWYNEAKEFCPSRKSRLGTHLEYYAFLGVCVKMLVEKGVSADDAWYRIAVGNYSLLDHRLSLTGDNYTIASPREPAWLGQTVCLCFRDLHTSYKILKADRYDIWLAGRKFAEYDIYRRKHVAKYFSTAGCSLVEATASNRVLPIKGVGWVVLHS